MKNERNEINNLARLGLLQVTRGALNYNVSDGDGDEDGSLGVRVADEIEM